MNALNDIRQERLEQQEKHGFDHAHDDQFDGGELEYAARAILAEDPTIWPKDMDIQRFLSASEKPTRARLITVAAMLAAEVDRIDRATAGAKRITEQLTTPHTH